MSDDTFDPKLPIGFNYSLKNGELSIQFFCDCCHSEIKVSQKLQQDLEVVEKSLANIFDDLKKELDGKFHRCEQCGFLICEKCWNARHQKCIECPICIDTDIK
ncbi:MAG: hypothetical protein ACTSXO_09545 [Candidatus Heimdallarchaeota archaeon]|nr:MAG: hypothetical protein DRO63_07750 [Candidatus Gerdarchaeota archaeon]RLI67739.1 MAG: hypothetical protein DRO91_09870 [Candidatus Heimdallarchaeota archaeon]